MLGSSDVDTLLCSISVRWFLYGLVLVVTAGKVSFWIFPNLDNEKCGFLDSFRPFYSVDIAKEKKKKKKHKEPRGETGSGEVQEGGGGGEGGEGSQGDSSSDEAAQEAERGTADQDTGTDS